MVKAGRPGVFRPKTNHQKAVPRTADSGYMGPASCVPCPENLAARLCGGSPRSIGWGRAALYRRAISTPQPNPLENTTRVHRRVEAARLGELQVENRGDRNEGEREGP